MEIKLMLNASRSKKRRIGRQGIASSPCPFSSSRDVGGYQQVLITWARKHQAKVI